MRIFFSGSVMTPQNVMNKPDIMLSFYTNFIKSGDKPDKILRTTLKNKNRRRKRVSNNKED